MVRKLVSKSIPIVHHVTIPCLESLLVSSSKGTVVAKVPSMSALATLFLLLRVVLNLTTYLVSFDVLLPVCVSVLFEMRNDLPYGCLLFSPPGDMSFHLLCHCHRVACQGARELLEARSECIWPPRLVEQSRLGVGKILLGLMTHPSSSYPR